MVGKQNNPVELDETAAHIRPDGDPTAMASTDARALLDVLLVMKRGDFSVRMRSDLTGVTGKIADTLNDIIAANQKMAAQLENVGQVVGRDGRTSTRVRFGLSDGAWTRSAVAVSSSG